MATATKLFKTVPTTTHKTVDDGVNLRLSKAEALTLATVLANVGGAMTTSARGHAQSILDTLSSVGINYIQMGDTATKEGYYFHGGSKELIDRAVATADQESAQQIAQVYAQQAAYINAKKEAAEQQQKANEDNQWKRVVGQSPSLGADYSGPVSAGAAIQNCLDKIPETIVNAKYKY